MSPDETVVLARYVRALCPQQKFDEYTPDAWYDVLGDYPLDAARTAAAAVARRQPFVSPAEIIGEISSQRADTAADIQGPGQPDEIPDADPDDVPAYLAAIRRQRTRAADGQSLRRRPVGELVEALADGLALPSTGDAALDEELAAVRRPGPLGIACPQCGAAIGRSCKAPARGDRTPRERSPHAARQTLARGEPLPDPAAMAAEIERRREASRRQLEHTQEPTT